MAWEQISMLRITSCAEHEVYINEKRVDSIRTRQPFQMAVQELGDDLWHDSEVMARKFCSQNSNEKLYLKATLRPALIG